ncbi:MAG TPA: hypothetical protein VG898_01650 [Solirubrobacterales bacterium]|nr:hypothetical protein [Solirubrobacterales bacterium]
MTTHTEIVDLGTVAERKLVRIPGDFSSAVTVIVALRVEQWEPDTGTTLRWWLADSVDDKTWAFVEDTDGGFSGTIGNVELDARLVGQARRFVVPIAPALAISVRPEVNEVIAGTDKGQFEGVVATVFWRAVQ